MPSFVRLFGVVGDSFNMTTVRFHPRLLSLVQRGLLTHLCTLRARLSPGDPTLHGTPYMSFFDQRNHQNEVHGNPENEMPLATLLRIARYLAKTVD